MAENPVERIARVGSNFLNGFTISDKGLLPGDKIQVGHSLLVVRTGDGR